MAKYLTVIPLTPQGLSLSLFHTIRYLILRHIINTFGRRVSRLLGSGIAAFRVKPHSISLASRWQSVSEVTARICRLLNHTSKPGREICGGGLPLGGIQIRTMANKLSGERRTRGNETE